MSRRESGGGRSRSIVEDRARGAPVSAVESGAQAIARALQSKHPPVAGLHIVSTPIGNLADITLRALGVLDQADVIACEDTRVTGKLLKHYGVRTPMTAYHEHNADRVKPKLIERLNRGEIVALVSDAGTPLVSDPGYRLVRAVVDEGICVTMAPGASASLAALVVSGLPSDRFITDGFLPTRQAARRRALAELAEISATLIFFESPRRLAACLADMARVLGPRDAVVARELTKLHEDIGRGTLDELAAFYRDRAAPKGEIVIVVAPPGDDQPVLDDQAIDGLLTSAMKTRSVRDAAALVAAETGLPRRRVYARALALAQAAGQ